MAEFTKSDILVVVGTRPEAIKLVPIILELRKSKVFNPIVISTGQHHKMVEEVFELAGIKTDVEMWVGSKGSRLNDLVAGVITHIDEYCTGSFGDRGTEIASAEEVLSGQYPAAVLVHGDTSSAMASALASFHLRIPVIHVEAGLRTGGSNLTPFPEELNRQLISCIACFHLAPTTTNAENLIRETIPYDQIFVTGNTGIDALHWAASLETPFGDDRVEELAASDRRIVVVTAHRRENWSGGLARIAEGVARIAAEFEDLSIVVPLHPNPIVRDELGTPLKPLRNVILAEPFSYAPFARLLARADLVITDSGGIQEEAPALDKPVLVMRESTERGEGVEAGTLAMVGTNPDTIFKTAYALLSDEEAYAAMAGSINPYGDGKAAERIVSALEYLQDGGIPPEPYGPGFRRDSVLAAAGYSDGLKPWLLEDARRGLPDEPELRNPDSWHQT